MLVLTFRIEEVSYAVPVARIVEVVPLVPLRKLPLSKPHLLGLLHYRGDALPVVDLSLLMGSRPSEERLDTRIIIFRQEDKGELIGLVAERVNNLVDLDENRLAVRSGLIHDAPFLGPVFETDKGLLQLVEPTHISTRIALEGHGTSKP